MCPETAELQAAVLCWFLHAAYKALCQLSDDNQILSDNNQMFWPEIATETAF